MHKRNQHPSHTDKAKKVIKPPTLTEPQHPIFYLDKIKPESDLDYSQFSGGQELNSGMKVSTGVRQDSSKLGDLREQHDVFLDNS